MPAKRPKGIASALIPFGIVALVAGCGGGSVVSHAGGGTTYIPPAGTGTPGPMVSAQLIVQIPARGGSSGKRRPGYYSASTQKLTLAYAASPNPLPSPTVFTVPTPGATPTSFPISVQVPVGTETFQVNTYDAAPCCAGPNGYLLSTAQVNQTINANGAQTITIVGAGVPNSLLLNFNNAKVLQNQAGDQTFTATLTARDYDNGLIAGPVAGSGITVSPTNAPAGVISVTPSTVTTLPATVAVTYKHANTVPGAVRANYSGPSVTGGTANFGTSMGVNPTSYLWVANAADNTVQILDAHTGATVTTVGLGGTAVSGPTMIAVQSSMNGCPGAAAAFVSDGTHGAFITMPTPAPSVAPSPAVIDAGSAASGSIVGAVAFGPSCVAYYGTGYLFGSSQIDVLKLAYGATLSSGASIISSASGGPLNQYGRVQAIVASGGNVYAGQQTGNIAKYDGTTASDLGFGYGTTALGPYLTGGFVAVAPTPGPSLAFMTYDGTTNDHTMTAGSTDTVTNIVPDGIGGFVAGEYGGANFWQWSSTVAPPMAHALSNYGIVMFPGSNSYYWALTDSTVPAQVRELNSGFGIVNTSGVGNSPKALGVGP